MIGIIGAMPEEVELLFENMTEKKKENHGIWTFYRGKLSGKDVVIVRSGIGKVNMAACAQKLIDTYKVDFLINTGVAGSLDADIDIGDIVLSTDCIQHDIDATKFGYDFGVIPQMDCSVFRADEKAIELALNVCRKINTDISVHTGRVLSGDIFVADRKVKERLVSLFAGRCTEMEGAAMAQVAYINNIRFLVIRAISDKADDSAGMDYNEFEKGAIKHLTGLVMGLVEFL